MLLGKLELDRLRLGFRVWGLGLEAVDVSICLGPKGFPHRYFEAQVYRATWTLRECLLRSRILGFGFEP